MSATRAATVWTRKKPGVNDQGMYLVVLIAVVLNVAQLQHKRTRTSLWPGTREQKQSNPTPIRALNRSSDDVLLLLEIWSSQND